MYLLFHDDWEIYGDGTGNPSELMFEPAKKNLDICDTYGAKYTFYAEIGQQLSMLDAPEGKWRDYAKTWENILKEAIARGHDVQLHFHPQWIGAELKNNKWKLDFSKWHTADIDNVLLDQWIGKGAIYIRQLLQSANPNYELLSYRAGGWMCQPSNNLYAALKNNGIVCDVSVVKGRYKKYTDGGMIDFRNAFSRFEPWEVDPADFSKKSTGSGLWELPVYSESSGLPHPLYLLLKSFVPGYYYGILKKRKIQKGGGDYSPSTVETGGKKDYYGSFGYMHYRHLLSYLKKVNKKHEFSNQINHLIFLTHSKSFLDYTNFKKLLTMLSQMEKIKFITTSEYIRKKLL